MNLFLHRIGLVLAFILVTTLLSACNIRGLFTDLSDDPVWHDPSAEQHAVSSAAEPESPGKVVYSRICAACHMANGKGALNANIPPLSGSHFLSGDPGIPIRIVLHGMSGPLVRGGTEINGMMTPWKDVLSDQDIADVLTYVRSSFGNDGSPIDASEVAAIRSSTESRTKPYSEAELQQPM